LQKLGNLDGDRIHNIFEKHPDVFEKRILFSDEVLYRLLVQAENEVEHLKKIRSDKVKIVFTLWSQQEFDAALINIGKLSAIQLRMRLSFVNLV